MAKVSAVIPTYNRAASLPAAIQSVLDQTFRDLEVIVVDDGSKDNTAEVVKRFQDERIQYIRHETNKGGSAARNTGIANSTGQYIAFLDDDDEWLPEKLEKQVALFDRCPPIVGGVYAGTISVHKATGRILRRRIPTKRGDLFQDMLTQNWVKTATTVVVRKACFAKVGLFDEELASAQDYDMWIRIAKQYHFECIAEPLAKYHVHDDKISTDPKAVVKGIEVMLKKYGDLFAQNKKNLSSHYRKLGVHYCYIDELAKGRKAFVEAIRVYPYEVRNFYNLGLSFLGTDKFARLKAIRNQLARSRRGRVRYNVAR